jgi:hypothetical protein
MSDSRRMSLCLVVVVTCICVAAPLSALSTDLGWGPTHASWEAGAVRSAVRFPDSISTAVRHADGSVEATLTSADGQLLARLTSGFGRGDAVRLQTRMEGELTWPSSTEVAYPAADRPVLDWVNLQLYSWWSDVRDLRTGAGATLSPSASLSAAAGEDFLRPARVEQSDQAAVDLKMGITGAELDYTDEYARSETVGSGFVTYLWSKGGSSASLVTDWAGWSVGPRQDGDQLLAILTWQEDTQVLSWASNPQQIAQGRFSELHAEDLPAGYYTFQPDMSWANVQVHELWSGESSTLVTSGLESIALRNSDGCDGLHWLDNSSLRPCCDQHDLCYRAPARFSGADCSANSWFWPNCAQDPGCSWRCQACNVQVVLCFAAGLRRHGPFSPNLDEYGIWWSWSWQPICHLDFPGYCPPECAWCNNAP